MSKLVLHSKFEKIGTVWQFLFDKNELNELSLQISQAVKASLDFLDDFEKKYSRFLPESLVFKINQGKVLTSFSHEIKQMLKMGLDLQKITDGHFSLAVGARLKQMGYDENYSFASKINKKEENQKTIRAELSEKIPLIDFDGEKLELNNGALLDFGGVGKGYAIDLVANIFDSFGVKNYLINAGGDILVNSDFEQKIVFQNPTNITEQIGYTYSKNGAFASSSGAFRNWMDLETSQNFHHLVSNVSGKNPSDVVGVFVQANSAFVADSLCTAFFVSPFEYHKKIYKTSECEYALVFKDESMFYSPKFSFKDN